MALQAGSRVFLLYDVPGLDLWHERLILGLAACGLGWCIVLTPDRDKYAEQVSLVNDDLRDSRLVLAGADLPFGLADGQCYRFAAFPGGAELRQMYSPLL
eukprot:TRINITY_DN95964_c0_g1_i1.p2 TRINITY_DN95964_c0_g1~~TRINITY_DN95964_c0_g1_i1.p2  ORF type:complete len:100 (+),score=15.83 TRINITY_DN95964_c0_g1_i1:87-386(+)